jgi:hypothetical protein
VGEGQRQPPSRISGEREGPGAQRREGEGLRRHLPLALAFAATLALSACAGSDGIIDWHRTAQLWAGSLCDAVSQCTWDADGDPYTRW